MSVIAVLGQDCVLTINGTEARSVRDVTIEVTAREADVTTRAAGGWRQTVATLREARMEMTILDIPGDPVYGALRDAFYGSGAGRLVTVSAGGVTGKWSVMGFERKEPLDGAVSIGVTLRLAEPGAPAGDMPSEP